MIRFAGHSRSGTRPRRGCPSWRGWGKKKPRPRCSFTPEFKAEIVELCRRGDRSVGQIAKDFDMTETAVQDWDHRPPRGPRPTSSPRPTKAKAPGHGE
ncbi:transposase [Streptomyces sp. NBC_00154]|uniref:transposase n=1 Tax=Streptomyces sp. NBC_00154 TaxID=2975670 RepID=UPI00338E0A6F